MLERDVSKRYTANQVLGHEWFKSANGDTKIVDYDNIIKRI